MARFTFGGDIHDLIARPDTTGALRLIPGTTIPFYAVATGGTVQSDYLVDNNGDGAFETASSAIIVKATGYLPDFQGPDGVDVLFFDPDPTDSDVTRVRYVARDSATGGLPTASETAVGVQRNATQAESDAGTSNTTTMTPLKVKQRITAHEMATAPHPEYNDALDALSNALITKANLVSGSVSIDELPATTAPTPATLVLRGDGGTAAAANAVADTDLLPLGQAKTLIANSTNIAGADVRSLSYTPGTPASASSSTAYTALSNIAVTDAASGQVWRCEYDIVYRATTGAGIQVRHKTQTAAVTNVLPNPSFESNLTGWTADNAITTISRGTTGGQDGTGFMIATATGAGAINVVSDYMPINGASVFSAAVQVRTHAGTARSAAIDIQFQSSTSDLGQLTLLTATYQQITNSSTVGTPVPAGATGVRVRIRYPNAVAGDAYRIDAVQLEPVAPLPAYGSTGGSGSSSLSVVGSWSGLTNAATTSDNYSKTTVIRSPAVAGLTTQNGGLGTSTDAVLTGSLEVTIGGTGLTGQRIEPEFAQRVTDGANPTTVVAARATYARLA